MLNDVIGADTMSLAIHEVCIILQLSSPRVCVGLIDQMKDTVNFIRLNTRLKATEVCGVLLGSQCFIGRSDNIFWKLDIPEPMLSQNSNYQNMRSNSAVGVKTSQILHLTDIHLDLEYRSGSQIACNEPICCRSLAMNDSPYNNTNNITNAGIWGSYPCDIPLRTVENAFTEMFKNTKHVDLWYWTGDIVAHDIWKYSKEDNIRHMALLTKLLVQYSNGSRVVPVVGNHETVPVNCFPPPSIQNSYSISWLYDELAQHWAQWLPKDAQQLLRYAGYYTYVVNKGFRVIVLNTNYCSRLNIWTYYDPVDPANQLKWLIKELVIAESDGYRVHIVGHVPVDNRECTQAWVYNYLAIVERFQHLIVGQFFGHTHADEFRLLYSNHNISRPIGVQILSPSLTTFEQFNPSYRIITVQQNGIISDIETFFFNITDANQLNGSSVRTPLWFYEYSMKNQYSITSFTANQFNQLYNLITSYEQYFNLFYSYYYRFSDYSVNNICNNQCRHKLLSDLIVINPYEKLPKSLLQRG
ncbi:sphingomyelin phosphodiesterase-like [Oppia nitens]|uniref:sphingomyelin phosphodiesterase-like n=1 Tax=Oppia nitens TaxID=1686743 RepID=UPI0023DA3D23|nr:sphingomyelin phosphodiesterase-like [Oppia nitens]